MFSSQQSERFVKTQLPELRSYKILSTESCPTKSILTKMGAAVIEIFL